MLPFLLDVRVVQHGGAVVHGPQPVGGAGGVEHGLPEHGLARPAVAQQYQVADVLRHVCVSRASLEPRFKQILGRTVHQEIQRVRLSRVQELLAATDMPIKQIARQVGFRYPEYMMRVFRRTTGQTLKEYRKSNRL